MRQRVLVSGAGGYLGSVLVDQLLAEGHRVVALDRFFGTESLRAWADVPGLDIVRDDVRTVDPGIVERADVVVDLAALSNDPSGALDPDLTRDINHRPASVSRLPRAQRASRATCCRARARSTAPGPAAT